MKEDLQFDGKKYISSRRAAQSCGYTQDYIGQLIRSKKIDARMVGRAWFVSEESVMEYKALADSLQGGKTLFSKNANVTLPVVEKVEVKPQFTYLADERPLLPELKKPEPVLAAEAMPETVSRPLPRKISIPGKSLISEFRSKALAGFVSLSLIASSFWMSDVEHTRAAYKNIQAAGEYVQGVLDDSYATVSGALGKVASNFGSLLQNIKTGNLASVATMYAVKKSDTESSVQNSSSSSVTKSAVTTSEPLAVTNITNISGVTSSEVSALIAAVREDLQLQIQGINKAGAITTQNVRNVREANLTKIINDSKINDSVIRNSSIVRATDLSVIGESGLTALTFINATGTNATTSNFYTDNLTALNITFTSSSVTNSTTSNATTTNLYTDLLTANNVLVSNFTSYASPIAPYFTATSTNSTSTFAGGVTVNAVGIGTTTGAATFSLFRDSGNIAVSNFYNTFNSQAIATSSGGGQFRPHYFSATATGTLSFQDVTNLTLDVANRIANGTTSMAAISSNLRITGTGNSDVAYGYRVIPILTTTGRVDTYVGFEARTPSITSGTIANAYGVYLQSQSTTGVTNGYGIYQAGSSDKNYFAGNVGVGSTTPFAKLSISSFNNGSSSLFAIGTSTGSGATSTAFIVDAYGSVGINTSNPNPTNFGGGVLAFRGANTSQTGTMGLIGNNVTGSNPIGRIAFLQEASGSTANVAFIQANRANSSDTSGDLTFLTSDAGSLTEKMRILYNGNVGVGSSSPVAKLSVKGSGVGTGAAFQVSDSTDSRKFVILDNGNVGIGVYDPIGGSDPAAKLHIMGPNTGVGMIRVGTNTLGTGDITGIDFTLNYSDHISSYVRQEHTGGWGTKLLFGTANDFNAPTTKLTIDGDGNVGIGTTSPYARLSVAGQVAAQSFVATSTTATSTFMGSVSIGTTSPFANGLFSVGTSSPNIYVDRNTGYVGVGTTSAFWQLTTYGRDGAAMYVLDATSSIGVQLTGNNPRIVFNDGRTGGKRFDLGGQVGPGTFGITDPAAGNASRFLVDYTGSIGIGTTSPYAKVSIASVTAASTTLALRPVSGQTGNILDVYNPSGVLTNVITAVGNVGIGTSSPAATLSVTGNGYVTGAFGVGKVASVPLDIQHSNISGSGWYNVANFVGGGNADNTGAVLSLSPNTTFGGKLYGGRWNSADRGIRLVGVNSVGVEKSYLHVNAESDSIALYNSNGSGVLVNSSGNVGIGTTSPYARLSVAGDVVASSFTATSTATSTFLGRVIMGTTTPTTTPAIAYVNIERPREANPALRIIGGNPSQGALEVRSRDLGTPGAIAVFSDEYRTKGLTFRYSSSTDAFNIFGDYYGPTASPNLILGTFDYRNDQLVLATNGNVGIGTTSPYMKLSVVGNTYVGGNFTATGTTQLATTTVSVSSTGSGYVFQAEYTGSNNRGVALGGDGTSGLLQAYAPSLGVAGAGQTLKINPNGGDVNIGPNAAPIIMFANGTIRQPWSNNFLGTYFSGGTYRLGLTTQIDGGNRVLYIDNQNADGIGTNPGIQFRTGAGPTTVATILDNGNLGIGTTTPNEKLSISGGGVYALRTDGNYQYRLANSSKAYGFAIASSGGNDFVLDDVTSGARRLTIMGSGGNIGGVSIGGSNALSMLDVAGSVAVGSYAGSSAAPSNGLIVSGNVGVGTTSPYAKLSVVGPVVAEYINATSSSATSTIAGILKVGVIAPPSTEANAQAHIFSNIPGKVGLVVQYGSSNQSADFIQFLNHDGIVKAKLDGSGRFSASQIKGLGGAGGDLSLIQSTSNSTFNAQFTRLQLQTDTNNTIIFDGGTGFDTTLQGYNPSGSTYTDVSLQPNGGNVGIGTTTPWAQLSVNSNGVLGPSFAIGSSTGTNFVVTNGGKVGIGTSSPSVNLNIYGDSPSLFVEDSLGVDGNRVELSLRSTAASGAGWTIGTNKSFTGGTQESLYFFKSFSPNGGTKMVLNGIGNLGIGTNLPASRLQIASSSVSTVATKASSYIQLGATENGLNSYRLLTFGYSPTADTYAPAYMGYQETANNGETSGDLVFGTRNTQTDTQPSERMRISASGNVGIGTTSPGTKLEIVGATTVGLLRLDGGDNQTGGNSHTQIAFGYGGTNQYSHFIRTRHNAGSNTNNAIDFYTSDGTANGVFPTNAVLGLTVSGGNAGIGTTSPFTKLSVVGNAYIGGNLTATGTLAVTGAVSAPYFSATDTVATSTFAGGMTVDGGTFVVDHATGRVGLGGVTPPATILHLRSAVGSTLRIERPSGSWGLDINAADTNGDIFFDSLRSNGGTGNMIFRTDTAVSAAERMRIQGDGTIGIGTTSPFAKLSIGMSSTTASFVVGTAGSSSPAFFVSSANGNGNVGIGTANPNAVLDVRGSSTGSNTFAFGYTSDGSMSNQQRFQSDGSGASLRIITPSAGAIFLLPANGTAAKASFSNSGACEVNTAYCFTGGNLGIGTTSPQTKLEISSTVSGSGVDGPSFRITNGAHGASVGAGNIVGTLDFYSLDPQVTGLKAQISALGDASSNWGPGGNSRSNLFLAGSDSGVQAAGLTVNYAGSVGIGTTSPQYPLSVAADNFISAVFKRTTTAAGGSIIKQENGAGGYWGYGTLGSGDNGRFAFLDNSLSAGVNERLSIAQGGNVGIGSTSPGYLLSVQQTGNVPAARLVSGANTSFDTLQLQSTASTAYASIGFLNTAAVAQGGFGYANTAVGSTLSDNIYFYAVNKDMAFSTNGGSVELLTLKASNGNVGIGTTSPYAKFSVAGQIVGESFVATSTTATSTFAGGFDVGNGSLRYDLSTGVTSIDNLEIGNTFFETDAGIIAWADMPVTAASANGVVNSYSASINGNPLLTVYSVSDGAGGVTNTGVGIGTTSPMTTLSVQGTTTAAVFNTYSLTGTSTFRGFLDVLGTGTNSTSTYSSNLWVKGNLRTTGNTYTGDLIFANNFAFTEGDLATTSVQKLILKSQQGNQLLVIDENGHVGFGTTSDMYKMFVDGDIAATSFVNVSTRAAKKDISYMNDTEKESVLTSLRSLGVARYRYNEESEASPLRLGLIAEEAPTEVLSAGGKGVDVYKLSTFILAGVQELAKKLDEATARITSVEARIAALEAFNQSIFASTSINYMPANASTTLDAFANWFVSLGASIEQGVVRFASVVADTVTAKKLTVGDSTNLAASGITILDRVTGKPACVFVENGVMKTELGECGVTIVGPAPQGNEGNTSGVSGDIESTGGDGSGTVSGDSTNGGTTTPEVIPENSQPGNGSTTPDVIVEGPQPEPAPEPAPEIVVGDTNPTP